MKIGLISDTHGFLDEKVFEYFNACDEIWHAGDIGSLAVCNALEEFRPLRAVHGNIDEPAIRHRYPEDNRFNIGGLSVWITHIAGIPPRYNPRVKKVLASAKPDILVAGHSHMLLIKKEDGILFINPGAAGQHGFHLMRTLIRFNVGDGRIENMEVIELGKRGALDARNACQNL